MHNDLWEAFRSDPSEEPFRPLYEETKALVYTICRRILRNPEDATDAFQSAYCRLLAFAQDPHLRFPCGDRPISQDYANAKRRCERVCCSGAG